MKYFVKIENIETNLRAGPKIHYSRIYLASDEEIKKIKGLVIKAAVMGFNPRRRVIKPKELSSLVWGADIDYQMVLDVFKEMDETTEDVYCALKEVSAFFPIQDGIQQLEIFIKRRTDALSDNVNQ